MLLEGGLVFVLLVDEDGGVVALDEVGDVGDAAGLLAGGVGERTKYLDDLLVIILVETSDER